MNEVLEAGGSLAYAVMGLGGLGALVVLLLAGVAFTKRRVPLAAFVVLPLAVGGLGALGAWLNAGTVANDVMAADTEQLAAVAAAGMWQSLTVDWLARWVAAALFALAAFAAGVGSTLATGPGEETRLTPVAAAAALGFGLLGAAVGAGYSVYHGLGVEAWLLLGLLVVGAVGVTFASARRALYEHANRVAGMRFTAAMCFMFAISYASKATVLGNLISSFKPGGSLTGYELAYAVGAYGYIAAPVYNLSWLVFGVAFLVAAFAVYNELGEVVQRFTVVDVFLTVLLLGSLGAVRVLEGSRLSSLEEVAFSQPAGAMFAVYGSDLPAALLSVEKSAHEVRPHNSSYGDVLTIDKDGNWFRQYRFHGTGWDDLGDEPEPIESVQLHPRVPLIVATNSTEAKHLAAVLERTPERRGLLLMRASELKAEIVVPNELAALRTTFLPISLSPERDLSKQLWLQLGTREVYWGPSLWFGDGMEKEPVLYQQAVFDATEAEGIHMLVSERGRVGEVAAICLSSVMFDRGVMPAPTRGIQVDEATLSQFGINPEKKWRKFESSGKWCAVTVEPAETFYAEAREAFELPNPDNAKMMVKVTGPVTDPAAVEDGFRRELGAIGYCAEKIKEAQPDLSGRMLLEVGIDEKGRIGGVYVAEKSKLTDETLARCAAMRFRRLVNEPLMAPEAKEGEKPEAPTALVEITLDIK